ncbi:MAG: preprotein translocase subunit SecY [Patescibacteria group bacterium]|jgi:preprotein translocase subunit SecY|nr:preprotein translocase subunit SecY [Patescibacteria group bacterium]
MNSFFRKIKTLVTDRTLRNRVLFVVGALFIFRLLASIPVPGVDATRISQVLSGNQFFGVFNALSGGGLSNFSIVMLGIGPYITASIIMQLLSMMVPRLKELMQESGELGRKKFNQYVRLLTLPLAALQAFSFIKYLQSQGAVDALSLNALVTNIIIIVGGSMLLLWIGELINEFGIGNGTSMIIMAGILSVMPSKIAQLLFTLTIDQLPMILLYIAIGLLVIAGVVYIYEAERPVQVTYARAVRGIRTIGGTSTYLPLRLAQAGVMPIIFASSLLLFPQFLSGVFLNSSREVLQNIGTALTTFLQTQWLYALVYFVLVVFFTYFYTAVTFDPKQIATNLQKNGAFIPGIRPGDATMNYLATIVTRITLVGSIFLGLVAVLPLIIQSATGITAFAIGGTSLLIVVSVVIDLIRKVDAQIALHE